VRISIRTHRRLGKLLDFLDEQIGIGKVLVVMFEDMRRPLQAMEAARAALLHPQHMVELDPKSEQSQDYLAVAQSGLATACLALGDPKKRADLP